MQILFDTEGGRGGNMTRDPDQCCGMIWERKVFEVAEGRNVDGKSRGGLLTKLGLYTLAFGSEASE